MLRLRPLDRDLVLGAVQVGRVRFWLLEFLPATRCQVHVGPGAEFVVPDREPEDLTIAVRRRIEEIIGCAVLVDGGPTSGGVDSDR